jgi:predicted peroxiredoxin
MSKLLVNATHGKEDPERAILPFVVGNVAVTADEAVVLLTIEAVWLATKGHADGIQKEESPPLPDALRQFVANGGQVLACGTCATPRGITAADLIAGAKIVSAANVRQRGGVPGPWRRRAELLTARAVPGPRPAQFGVDKLPGAATVAAANLTATAVAPVPPATVVAARLAAETRRGVRSRGPSRVPATRRASRRAPPGCRRGWRPCRPSR